MSKPEKLNFRWVVGEYALEFDSDSDIAVNGFVVTASFYRMERKTHFFRGGI
ncbi:MAG: hypothetical protein ACRC62_34030 [Microcoleus sp.]